MKKLASLTWLIFALIVSSTSLANPSASAPSAESALPEDYWQALLKKTQHKSLERKLAEEARLQLNSQETQAQAQALATAKQALKQAEQRRAELESEQEQLETQLQEAEQRLQIRSTALGEVFAVYREEKSNLFGMLSNARYSQQYPELMAFAKPNQTEERLPLITDFYQLWQALQQSWLATGQVVNYTAPWVDQTGQIQTSQLTRLGDLQLMNNQGVLRLDDQDLPSLWLKQPAHLINTNQAFIAGKSNLVSLDPARGLTLELHSRQPSLLERVKQGGFVGYLIIILGLAGLLVAFIQSLRLWLEEKRVVKQLAQPEEPQPKNALGRILTGMQNASQAQTNSAPEVLEASLDELLVREGSALEKGLALVKLLAAMAPLLGLLGTVTGMIATFQAITLFGTGDPAMMASGISQALVTTVLGLLTAVPLLLAHLLLQGRSRKLARIIEAESSAWLAKLLNQAPRASKQTNQEVKA
ncbi:MotA/TolQ/ExbB proton channel family protein [Marinospirillum insulare]|uniref:Biopolymer transporter TonB n=1 Tax=Marinospirillum insulare TaxID=217169 RepID=A0ABQ6A534_9GAMM|nr:MotA/TolQ/ExbB proton channel family protein [Marinospirillum insulare]GLR65234.1 biopolymer transporter TonB [Marinospirillum insulare]